MKLYKFRSFTDKKSFDYVCNIIKSGKFFCSKLWDLNDPMEGVYSSNLPQGKRGIEISKKIFDEKNKYVICSFSKAGALNDPRLWGHYANGFKGIAIEIEVDPSGVIEVEYVSKKDLFIDTCENNHSEIAKKVIIKKLKVWDYEKECRFLYQADKRQEISIGKIKKIYFGNPYGHLSNKESIEMNSDSYKDYAKFKKELIQLCQEKGIELVDYYLNGTQEQINSGDWI